MRQNICLVKMVYMSIRGKVLLRLPRLSEHILNTPVPHGNNKYNLDV